MSQVINDVFTKLRKEQLSLEEVQWVKDKWDIVTETANEKCVTTLRVLLLKHKPEKPFITTACFMSSDLETQLEAQLINLSLAVSTPCIEQLTNETIDRLTSLRHNNYLKTIEDARRADIHKEKVSLIDSMIFDLSKKDTIHLTDSENTEKISNRAMRSKKLPSGKFSISPDYNGALTGNCDICCNENRVLSLMFHKNPEASKNVENFSMTFPLAAGAHPRNNIISTQVVCVFCANKFMSMGKDIHNVEASSFLPLVPLSTNCDTWYKCLAETFTCKRLTPNVLPILLASICQARNTYSWGNDDIHDKVFTFIETQILDYSYKKLHNKRITYREYLLKLVTSEEIYKKPLVAVCVIVSILNKNGNLISLVKSVLNTVIHKRLMIELVSTYIKSLKYKSLDDTVKKFDAICTGVNLSETIKEIIPDHAYKGLQLYANSVNINLVSLINIVAINRLYGILRTVKKAKALHATIKSLQQKHPVMLNVMERPHLVY